MKCSVKGCSVQAIDMEELCPEHDQLRIGKAVNSYLDKQKCSVDDCSGRVDHHFVHLDSFLCEEHYQVILNSPEWEGMTLEEQFTESRY